jgi:protein subunit release factor A
MEGLLKYQSQVIESLEQENNKFQEHSSFDFDGVLKESKQYLEKITHLKKDVSIISDKSHKLQERALRLKDKKMKEALEKELKRERIQEQERKLQPLIRPSPSFSSSN